MYEAPPLEAEVSATPSPTNAVAKGGFGKWIRSFRALFGTTGTPDAALMAMRLLDPQAFYNLRLVPSLPGANVLRGTVKGNDDADLSADNPGMLAFRPSAMTDGNTNLRKLVANLVLDVTAGATLGHVSAVAAPLYWYIVEKDAATWKLAVCGTFLGFSGRFSTTLMSDAADSATVLYADEAMADKPGRLAFITLDTQAVAGTWAAVPSEVRAAPFHEYVRGTLPRGHLSGLALSNNAGDAANDIDIAPGCARDGDDNADLRLYAALVKQLDVAWAPGTNAGMRATGAAIANGTYHIFLIRRPDTGVVDIAADTSVTGANIAANTNAAYTQKRRIGSILREAAAIVGFTQKGERFLRKTPVQDVNANVTTANRTLTALSVPIGVKVRAIVAVLIESAAGNIVHLTLTDPEQDDHSQPMFGNEDTGTSGEKRGGYAEVGTNTAAQIGIRGNVVVNVNLHTWGWVDARGRDD